MVYEKKYPLAQFPHEHLLLSWERGYKSTKLFYKDRELIHINAVQKLKKGVRFQDEELGIIELKFSEKPIGVDVIVGGIHSPVNNSHPEKKIKSIAGYFYMFAALALFYVVLAYTTLYDFHLNYFILVTEIPFIILYVLCAVYARKSKAWAIYTGFIVFCFFTLSTFLSLALPLNGLSTLLNFIILAGKAVFILLMVPYVKYAAELPKYRAFQKVTNINVIDDL